MKRTASKHKQLYVGTIVTHKDGVRAEYYPKDKGD
jgi:hypothetical protein